MFSKGKLYVIGFIGLLVLSVNVISYGGEKGNNISNGEKKMKEEIKKRREKARANLDKLIEELRNGPEIAGREFSAIDLGIAEDPRAIPALIEAMKKDPVLSVRKEAITALGMIGDKSVIPVLREGLKEEKLKWACAESLLQLGDRKTAWPVLTDALEDEQKYHLIRIFIDLAEKGDKEAIEVIKKASNSKYEELRKWSKDCLEKIKNAERERNNKKVK